MKTQVQVQHSFSEFYHTWLSKLQHILPQLIHASNSNQTKEDAVNDQDLKALMISKVTAHLKEYYSVKWASAHEDVLPFYSPPWLTPLEIAYFSWLTGWKPSAAFRLLGSLTEEQRRKIEEVRARVRAEEAKVEREMERLQVAMADRKMVELAKMSGRRWRRPREGGDEHVDGMVEVAVKGVMGGLDKVMKGADCVRLKALKGTLDVLTPSQSLEFLAALITLHLRLRQWNQCK